MSFAEWLEHFRAIGVLSRSTSATPKETMLLMIDGVNFVDAHIKKTTSPHMLSQRLCDHLETASADRGVSSVCVLFASRVVSRLPATRETLLDTDTALHNELLNHFLNMSSDDLFTMSKSLHGSSATTEWPRPLLKDANKRQRLWHHPLFQWQLFYYLGNRLRARVPSMQKNIEHLLVSGVSELATSRPWSELYSEHQKMVAKDAEAALDELNALGPMARYQKTMTTALLTNLSLGYRTLGNIAWNKDKEAFRLDAIDPRDDIYAQATSILIESVLARVPEEGESPLHVHFQYATAETVTLWYFLFLMHRLYKGGRANQLALVVSFANSEEVLDMNTLYASLRDITRDGSFDMEEFLFVLLLQSHPSVGVPVQECLPRRTWQALRQKRDTEILVRVYDIHEFADRLRDEDAPSGCNIDRRSEFSDCVGVCSLRYLETLSQIIAAHSVMERRGCSIPGATMALATPISPFFLEAFLKQKPIALDPEWTDYTASRPFQHRARVLRAWWILEVISLASLVGTKKQRALKSTSTHLISGVSQWGYTEKVFSSLNDLQRRLLQSDIRVRTIPGNRGVQHLQLYFSCPTDYVFQ